MAMRLWYGTPVMCTAMAPPERREYAPMSSGENPSLSALTLIVSARRTVMMSEALIERRRWWESVQLLTGVAPGHPCSRMRRKMLTPAKPGQASADSDRKCEADFPWIAFFWLFRVRNTWVACWICSTGVSDGRSRSSTKKTKSRRGRKWTVQW